MQQHLDESSLLQSSKLDLELGMASCFCIYILYHYQCSFAIKLVHHPAENAQCATTA